MKEIVRINKLTVKYNERVVGLLKQLDNGKIGFQYDPTWIDNGFSISTFSLPLSEKVYIANNNNFNGLFGVFADSLPDGWGELLLIRLLSKKGYDYNRLSPLTKLSLIGNDGLGGLSYIPSQSDIENDYNHSLDEISVEYNRIINNEMDIHNLDYYYRIGGSSGGTRPKAHLKIDNEDWIVKFSNKLDDKDSGLKEYEANIMAKKCGIRVTEFNLFESKLCSGYYGTKRFDRKGIKRIHMISLSSLLETNFETPNLDYMHLFQVIDRICNNRNDIVEAYKRMCFNVLYGNKDDHGKNFAFLYDEEQKSYKLTPFYDITKTEYKIEHEMTILGNGKPNEKDLIKIAKRIGISTQEAIKIIENIKIIIEK